MLPQSTTGERRHDVLLGHDHIARAAYHVILNAVDPLGYTHVIEYPPRNQEYLNDLSRRLARPSVRVEPARPVPPVRQNHGHRERTGGVGDQTPVPGVRGGETPPPTPPVDPPLSRAPRSLITWGESLITNDVALLPLFHNLRFAPPRLSLDQVGSALADAERATNLPAGTDWLLLGTMTYWWDDWLFLETHPPRTHAFAPFFKENLVQDFCLLPTGGVAGVRVFSLSSSRAHVLLALPLYPCSSTHVVAWKTHGPSGFFLSGSAGG